MARLDQSFIKAYGNVGARAGGGRADRGRRERVRRRELIRKPSRVQCGL